MSKEQEAKATQLDHAHKYDQANKITFANINQRVSKCKVGTANRVRAVKQS